MDLTDTAQRHRLPRAAVITDSQPAWLVAFRLHSNLHEQPTKPILVYTQT